MPMNPARLLAALGMTLGATGGALYLLRDQTTDNDTTGEDVGRIDVGSGAKALGARAVEVLSRHVGEKGQGKKGTPGYHRSPLIDRINVGFYNDAPSLIGAAWCARAVRWAYEVAAQELGMGKPFAKVKNRLSLVSQWKGAPLKGYKLSAPKVGAAVALGDRHLTMVARVIDSRTFVGVEGNHGDSIAHVKRTIDPAKDMIIDVDAFVRDAADGARVAGLDLLGAQFIG